ncbi:hypothetical protein [Nocardioides sp. NPDC127503]|uniref:hypothetical protein n=1 Tax=Nocardioides sp. NPDC127503 TaxID=3154516 RepID=UPI003329031B
MTTSDDEPALVRVLNNIFTLIGFVVALPLAALAVATASWGYAAASVAASAIGATAGVTAVVGRSPRTPVSRRPTKHPRHRQKWFHTYFYISPTRISVLHAQIYGGEEGERLIKTTQASEAGGELKLDVPPVSVMGKGVRQEATEYQRVLNNNLTTMAADVLSQLEAEGLIHEAYGDLQHAANLVAQPQADDQFLMFTVPGPELRAKFVSTPQSSDQPRDLEAFEITAHNLTITLHVSTHGNQEDFHDLERRDNAAVVGVLRNLNLTDRTATVRVIAVY